MDFISPLKITTLTALKKLVSTTFGAIAAIGGARHYGIDLAAAEGTPIYAPADGTVKSIDLKNKGGGKVLIISHPGGYEEVFAHLSKISVGVDDKIVQGQLIAASGSTGQVTGPHLHWEVKKDGKPIDPLTTLRTTYNLMDYGTIPILGGNPIEAVTDTFASIGEAVGFIFDPQNWVAFLALLAGVALLVFGGFMVWSAV